ncbi:MAG TPA: FAD-dependent oxidoreductase [Candidatus Nanoarchaeia archaeon]|nr:FAD-dependent oxidoreductase [Candidatus Nanoarchaeia archaeon]
MKKVVIIGGGFSGALAAQKLERENFSVTLIDTKDYFEFTPGILRTIVEPEHAKRIEVLHRNYLDRAKVIIGEVIDISDKNVLVKIMGKKKHVSVKFNYLFISSGSRYNSPIKEKNLVISSRTSMLKKSYEKVLGAKNILIIGGGIVGTELAAEIITHYKNKKLTMVHSKPYLMERQNDKARKYAENFLKERGVKIIFNERTVKRDGKNYITDKGTKIRTDLAFLCTGIEPNFEFMKRNFPHLLNEKNQVKVNSFLQIEGQENIFAAGDITAIPEEKLAQNAEKQGRIAAGNIINLENGGNLKEYKSNPRIMVISLGKWDGIITYRNIALTGIIPGILKTLIEWRTMLRYKFKF